MVLGERSIRVINKSVVMNGLKTQYCLNKLSMNIFLLSQTDPLDKVLAAFSSAVELPQEQMKFEFDGDPVLPDSTAEMLGLEDDDVIDARTTS